MGKPIYRGFVAETLKLNLGCGEQTPAGWVNVDYSLGARLAKLRGFRAVNRRLRLFGSEWSPDVKLHDLRTPFPWATGSVDCVYSSHTLEHLTPEEGRRFLLECHRVLREGAPVRLVLPDLRHLVERYSAERSRRTSSWTGSAFSTSHGPGSRSG
jgi:predicted SAM-dependent methyltransferase